MQYRITEAHRISVPQLFSNRRREGWSATIEVTEGTLSVSRFSDETHWLADSFISANGFPFFVHGEGARHCAKQPLDADVAAALETYIKETA